MNRLLRAASSLALIAVGCSSPPPPPRRAPTPAPAAPKPVQDETQPVAATSIYVYSPIGKRDPFESQTTPASTKAELRGRTKTPLEKWGLDQLRLSLTVTGTATPMAMVEDPDKRGWTVRLGDFIGLNGGKVTGIHRDEIIVTETITDHSTGRVYPQNVKLIVPVTKNEERDQTALQEGEHLGPATRGEK